MAWAAIAIPIAGMILQGYGQYQAGKAQQKQAEQLQQAKLFEAAQMDQIAGQEQASAQRRALEQRRRASLVASRALAVSAASGASASDPTVEKIISDIAGEGEYRAGLEIYSGEERARRLRMGAQGAAFEGATIAQYGQDRARAGTIAAFGSLASGAGSLYTKYGMGGPKSSSPLGTSYYDAGTPTDPRFA